MADFMELTFITGSPRSGTTILGNIMNCHRDIGEWYEPYYIWLRYFDNQFDDVWQAKQNVEYAFHYIRKEFNIYAKKIRKTIVVDKSPGHAFNIERILQVFPNSKWIHILRDGRDVTLSIRIEWEKRKKIVVNKDFRGIIDVVKTMLKRQPFLRYKLKTIAYELRTNFTLNPRMYLNKSKWKGEVGWGPRFHNWQSFLKTHSALEFNAKQWVKSVEAVRSNWKIIPDKNRIEIRYENMLQQPRQTLTKILNFIGFEAEDNFFNKIPKLKKNNFNKWEKEFTKAEISQIKPILSPLLDELGYTQQYPW